MTTPTEPIGANKGWPWGRIVLGLSLAVNLLFVGSIMGAGFLRHQHDWRREPPEFIINRVLKRLPEEKRGAIRALMRQNRDDMRGKFEALRAGRKALRETLRAETFSAEAVRAAAQPLLKLRGEMEANKVELLIRVLEGLDGDERRRLLESRFFRRLLDADGRHGGDGAPPPPPPPGDDGDDMPPPPPPREQG